MILLAQEVEKHEHMVAVGQTAGECSYNKKHSHPVLIQDGRVILGEVNGHSHPLTEELPKAKADIKKDRARIKEVVELYRYGMDIEEKSRKKAKEALDFYAGDQWPEDAKQKLNSEQRAALTINLVASAIDLLSGYFRRNRTDIKYKPVEHGDSKMADILSIVTKQVLTRMGYHAEEVEVFEEQIKTGRGCFHIYMDFDSDIQGELKVECFPQDHVVFGPHVKKSGDDMDYLVKWTWYTMDELQALFPEHKDELKFVDDLVFHSVELRDGEYLTDGVIDTSYMVDVNMANKSRKMTRLLECEQREYRTVFTFINAETGESYEADDLPEDKINDLRSLQSLMDIRRKTFRLRETVVGGGVLLEDRYITGRPGNHFSVIPVYCYKHRNEFWGKIEFGKDPQMELNKRRSQIVDLMNRMAGSGYFIDDQTFDDHAQEDEFRQVAPRAGWVQKVSSLANVPLRQDPPPIPTGLVQADQMSIAAFREVTHVSPEMLGQSGKTESGVALMQKQRQGVLGNEFIFDNFSHAKQRLGKIIAQYIQKYYKERIPRILISSDDLEVMKIGGETASSYTLPMIEQLVSTSDALEYDVVVSESQFSTTAREANLAILTVMAQSGMPIPPEFLLMFVDIAEKEKLMQAFQAQQQRQEQEEQRKYKTEIDKTIIAQQNKEKV